MNLKSIISISLAAAIIGVQAQQISFVGYSSEPPPTSAPQPKALACPILLMATAAAAGLVVIWIYVRSGGCLAGKRLILEQDCDRSGSWAPIATNDVLEPIPATMENQWEIFASVIKSSDACCKFRVKVTDIPKPPPHE